MFLVFLILHGIWLCLTKRSLVRNTRSHALHFTGLSFFSFCDATFLGSDTFGFDTGFCLGTVFIFELLEVETVFDLSFFLSKTCLFVFTLSFLVFVLSEFTEETSFVPLLLLLFDLSGVFAFNTGFCLPLIDFFTDLLLALFCLLELLAEADFLLDKQSVNTTTKFFFPTILPFLVFKCLVVFFTSFFFPFLSSFFTLSFFVSFSFTFVSFSFTFVSFSFPFVSSVFIASPPSAGIVLLSFSFTLVDNFFFSTFCFVLFFISLSCISFRVISFFFTFAGVSSKKSLLFLFRILFGRSVPMPHTSALGLSPDTNFNVIFGILLLSEVCGCKLETYVLLRDSVDTWSLLLSGSSWHGDISGWHGDASCWQGNISGGQGEGSGVSDMKS